MSLIGKIFKSGARIIGGLATGGIAGGVAVATAGLAKGLIKSGKTIKNLPALPSMPGVGQVVKTVGGYAAGSAVYDAFTGTWRGAPKKRRRKGITPKDLQSFKRVARLIDKFSAPVHRLKKSSFKHHHQ